MLIVNEGLVNGEVDFELHDSDPDDYRIVNIHPWNRGSDHSVFVSVGTYENAERGNPEGVENNDWNIIVNREDFVEGLLAVFPELKRAD
ncbi:hypothetical protein SEA_LEEROYJENKINS_80 [Microbacterium phage LeeroyJenkins]|nr:hypothetical protein SEA_LEEROYJENKINS_80 [Microbacterium phage LeeroyJenkins]USH44530.1 hypothetical protein SEA_CASSITA_76 [Microbacterium phage Cassita]